MKRIIFGVVSCFIFACAVVGLNSSDASAACVDVGAGIPGVVTGSISGPLSSNSCLDTKTGGVVTYGPGFPGGIFYGTLIEYASHNGSSCTVAGYIKADCGNPATPAGGGRVGTVVCQADQRTDTGDATTSAVNQTCDVTGSTVIARPGDNIILNAWAKHPNLSPYFVGSSSVSTSTANGQAYMVNSGDTGKTFSAWSSTSSTFAQVDITCDGGCNQQGGLSRVDPGKESSSRVEVPFNYSIPIPTPPGLTPCFELTANCVEDQLVYVGETRNFSLPVKVATTPASIPRGGNAQCQEQDRNGYATPTKPSSYQIVSFITPAATKTSAFTGAINGTAPTSYYNSLYPHPATASREPVIVQSQDGVQHCQRQP